jgi:heterodisulfide reductase subunit A-like polyferredoxin
MSEVVKLKGEAGSFKATVRQRPRYVDLDKCTGCGECTSVCPISQPSTFDGDLAERKGIDKLYA